MSALHNKVVLSSDSKAIATKIADGQLLPALPQLVVQEKISATFQKVITTKKKTHNKFVNLRNELFHLFEKSITMSPLLIN